ncbi:hypothetical protein N0V82_002293 [Gnomoniopsis sp. IMI 355080]|nr:hypothetical protein N0V82_002293 [Gnomoniopsis sp. IMI 355080]
MLPSPIAMSGALFKRGAEVDVGHGDGNGNMAQLPGWAVIVLFADFLVFFPIFFYIGYTLSSVYPTLAAVEDPLPPAYTTVSLDDQGTTAPNPVKSDDDTLVTTSLRRIDRLLRQTAGWTANFRGLACAIFLNIAISFCGVAVSWIVPRHLGLLAATLATVQLSTAWTHIVITTPSTLHFWQRLPPFGKTFKATWLPVTAWWAAFQITWFVPVVLGRAFGLSQWDPSRPTSVPDYSGHAIWQSFIIVLVTIACAVLLVIPADVILIRVQASLLPADADTIVPFDRSFGGKVEPEVVTGRGYVDFQTAWATFERASWIRLYKLLAKITAVTFVAYALVLAIVVPEIVLMLKTSEPAGSA